jgi:hypothetical protein
MKTVVTKSTFASLLLLLGVAVLALFPEETFAAEKKPVEFAFKVPRPNARFETPEPIIAQGVHKLASNDHVWMFLVDIFGGYYIQSPQVELLKDGKWEATNIRPSKGIRTIVAAHVDAKGHERILRWIEVDRFGKISSKEVKELPGYRELDRVSIVTPKPD